MFGLAGILHGLQLVDGNKEVILWEKYIGKKVKVLLEENHIIENKKYIIGFTDTYVRVALENPEEKLYTNQIVNVRVKKLFEKDMVIGVAEN